MSLMRWRSASVAPSIACFIPANRWSSNRGREVLIFEVLTGLGAAPVVVRQFLHGLRRRRRQVADLHFGEPGVVVEVAGELFAPSRTARSRSSRISWNVPSRFRLRSSSWRRRLICSRSLSRPRMFCEPRRRYSRRARCGDDPAITSSPISRNASRRSTGGASGPVRWVYRW